MKLTYASVCSGIEAASMAWHSLGWTGLFVSEIEPFPCAVLKHRWPQIPNHGDMTKFHEWPIAKPDVVCGGTPCQSFSIAGLRKGLADPRGNLALTFLGVVERYAPRWVVWENVPGVFSSWSDVSESAPSEESERLLRADGLDPGDFVEVDQSNDLDCFLAGLRELGYGVALASLDAQYFGVAQRRERVFVVGHAGGLWQRAAAVLFDRQSLCGNHPPGRQTREGVAPTISARTEGGGGLGTDFDCDGGVITTMAIPGRGDSCDLETREDGTANAVLTPNGGRGGIGCGAVAIPIQEIGKRQSGDPSNGAGHSKDGDPMFTLQKSAEHGVCATITKNYATHHGRTAGNNGGVAENQLIPETSPALKRIDFKEPSSDGDGDGAPLIPVAFDRSQITSKENRTRAAAGLPMPPLCETGQPHIATQMAVRRLTPRECERLQGFPDDYTLVPFRGKPACDGPRYKALGNSMAVPVMAWIGRRIEQVEQLL